jgi:hypothetical protein
MMVEPTLTQKDKLSAPLVFNQLNYMYQKVKITKETAKSELSNN